MAYYLKCRHCKGLSEARQELVFCSNCGQRLKPNYREWSRKHPRKDFQDFLARFGVPKKKLETKKDNAIVRSRSMSASASILGFAIMLALILLLKLIFSEFLFKEESPDTPQQETISS